MNNPFTMYPIVDPDSLVGRTKLLEELQSSLNAGSVLLFGGHRSGKTSLIKCLIKANQDNQDEEWMYWDAHSFAVKEGFSGILEKNGIQSFDDKINEVRRLIIIIDEFDVLGKSGYFRQEDFENIRALLTRYDKKFRILAATSTRAVEIEMHGSDLLNMFETFYVRSLEISSSDEFYQAYLCGDKGGYEEKKELFKLAGTWAGLHPWLLQIAGDVVARAETKDDYYEKLRLRGEDISRWANKLFRESLSEFERIQYYIKTMADTKLERIPFEPLGLIANEVIPGVLSLFMGNYIREHTIDIPLDKKDIVKEARHEVVGKSIEEALKHPYFSELLRYGVINIDGQNGRIR